MKIKQISPQKSKFLKKLDAIALKPKMLYYYGQIPGEGEPSDYELPRVVAIVGSRKMTAYGKEMAYKAAYELAKYGVIIVSGLALGIDAMAHRGALDAGGITVGFLGTPIDRMYPRSNSHLAREILEKNGAIISECPPFDIDLGISEDELATWHKMIDSRNGAKATFLTRNRLISGVADAVIVVEADERSGSLNTASHALEQGRLLFAVPGDVTRQMSRGCNSLFGKGAIAYTKVDDVLDELFIKKKDVKKAIKGDTEEEDLIISALQQGINVGDAIIQATGLSVPVFNQTITLLEIKGVVKRLYANQWMLR
ncbi:MAG: DNA-protecting protein DprA [Candidatus Saccharibacteria bacterium]|nr:DNA-protecting protein DprA [Candidatus Saccharibacteria bacterium]